MIQSRCLIHAASQGPESHGAYLEDAEIKAPSDVVTKKKHLDEQIWAELSQKLESIVPGCVANFAS